MLPRKRKYHDSRHDRPAIPVFILLGFFFVSCYDLIFATAVGYSFVMYMKFELA